MKRDLSEAGGRGGATREGGGNGDEWVVMMGRGFWWFGWAGEGEEVVWWSRRE